MKKFLSSSVSMAAHGTVTEKEPKGIRTTISLASLVQAQVVVEPSNNKIVVDGKVFLLDSAEIVDADAKEENTSGSSSEKEEEKEEDTAGE